MIYLIKIIGVKFLLLDKGYNILGHLHFAKEHIILILYTGFPQDTCAFLCTLKISHKYGHPGSIIIKKYKSIAA